MKFHREMSGRTVARRFAAPAFLLLCVACGHDPFALSSEAVEDHRARWLAAGIDDYEYDYRRQCECLPTDTRPARVRVRDGRVATATYSDSGELAGSFAAYPTVEELFDLVDEAIVREAAMLVVSYDSRLGYPTKITIDYDLQAADDELTIEAHNLVSAPDTGVFQDLVAR
ncbi:MAG: DUF6174 domain-containing protein [Gemmatimonadota bacterium]|nr:DUF6174 domain-containing protein [Gemmatimonadota bacterium]